MKLNTFVSALLASVVLLQGCAGTPINKPPKPSNFKWDDSLSTAKNITNAIGVDDLDDKDLPPELRKNYDSRNEVFKVAQSVGDGLAVAESVGTIGTLSDLGAVGFGVMRFLTKNEEYFNNESHFVYWMPYSEGDTVETHMPHIVNSIRLAHENLASLSKENYVESLTRDGNTVDFRLFMWRTNENKTRGSNMRFEVNSHGVVPDAEAPPKLRGRSDSWLLISAKSTRASFIYKELAADLEDNEYFYMHLGPSQEDRAPRVYHKTNPHYFIKP